MVALIILARIEVGEEALEVGLAPSCGSTATNTMSRGLPERKVPTSDNLDLVVTCTTTW